MLMWFMMMSDLAFIIIMNKFKFKLFTRLLAVISMDYDGCIRLDGTIILVYAVNCNRLYELYPLYVLPI